MKHQIDLRVNEDGTLVIPVTMQEWLVPGAILSVESRDSETLCFRVLTPDIDKPTGPQIVYKDGLPVIRGEVAPDFDWDAFMQEGRDAPMHAYEPLAQ